MSYPKIQYSEFRTRVRQRAFPDLVPENLSSLVDRTIQDALNYLYRHVPGLESETVRDLTHEDALSLWGNSHVFCPPDGRIILIYTYLPGIRGSEIYLDEIPYPDFLALNRATLSQGTTKELREKAFSFVSGEPRPLSYTAVPPATRASTYQYARFGGRLYVYPALGSTERIAFHSEKRPTTWYSTDFVDGSPTFERAVSLYVMKDNALLWDRDPQAAKLYDGDYRDAVGELIWEKEYDLRAPVVQVPHGRGPWPAPETDTNATSGDGIGGGDVLVCDSSGWPASAADGNWVLSALGRLYGRNVDEDTWHEVQVVGSDSAPSLEIGEATTTPTGGSGNTGWPSIDPSGSAILTTTGDLYFKNSDDGNWHSVNVYLAGDANAFELTQPGGNAPSPNTGNAAWPSFPASARWVLTREGALSGKNLDTLKWHRVDAVGATATPSLQLQAPGTSAP